MIEVEREKNNCRDREPNRNEEINKDKGLERME